MNLIIIFIIVTFLIIYFYNYLGDRSRRYEYMKAGKKWDAIIEELRKRK